MVTTQRYQIQAVRSPVRNVSGTSEYPHGLPQTHTHTHWNRGFWESKTQASVRGHGPSIVPQTGETNNSSTSNYHRTSSVQLRRRPKLTADRDGERRHTDTHHRRVETHTAYLLSPTGNTDPTRSARRTSSFSTTNKTKVVPPLVPLPRKPSQLPFSVAVLHPNKPSTVPPTTVHPRSESDTRYAPVPPEPSPLGTLTRNERGT